MRFPDITLRLPAWVQEEAATATALDNDAARMRFVIGLSRGNVQRRTGGPFAAAVFNRETGALVAPGVNVVVPGRCSVAHAEMMALMTAQTLLGTHDLGAAGVPPCELVTSTEPCAMCLGAIPWSGIQRLVCGADTADAEGIGLDEGAKPADWAASLEARGIAVVRRLCRSEAAAVLQDYAAGGGLIYNGRARHSTP